MSSESSNATGTAPSSRCLEATEGAGRERIATAQDGTLDSNRSRTLNDEVVNAEKELTSLKARNNCAQDELVMLKTRAADLHTRCEKYEKTKGEIAARINNLTTRLREEKSSKLEELSSVEQSVQQLYNSLTQTVWTPEALERMAEGLRAQKREVEQECKHLDVVLESKKAELQQAQMQSSDSVATEEVILEPEEHKMALEIFRGEAEKLQRLLGQLTLKKQQLVEEIDCLSRP